MNCGVQKAFHSKCSALLEDFRSMGRWNACPSPSVGRADVQTLLTDGAREWQSVAVNTCNHVIILSVEAY